MTTATLSQTITIGPGTRRDYGELAGLHYRAGPPATIALREDGAPCILAARDGEGRLAGVLVVSMPTLNGSWRRLAWPGAYGGADKRRNARASSTPRCAASRG